ncbi:hypothetical protein HNQ80_004176 [Anaerosolibacter carboniphilus]|uniref:Uncharacterized protein n=1 Tax=Anaerosolibacter carboniphilus TaxID=1417629 RepID=A0A841KXF6_9FIRM|nr:hypothetical protein [Anaerosolibacter carboniphilus]MBB6218037.1 hypothetical protein [Anaerosolibacter carboniphilus]
MNRPQTLDTTPTIIAARNRNALCGVPITGSNDSERLTTICRIFYLLRRKYLLFYTHNSLSGV